MRFDPKRVSLNARNATTDDLLDRVTVYRDGMEPEAISIIEEELRGRGIGPMEIHAHRLAMPAAPLKDTDGFVRSCSFCRRPAIAEGWDWFRLWRRIPIFPWRVRYCEAHRPPEPEVIDDGAEPEVD